LGDSEHSEKLFAALLFAAARALLRQPPVQAESREHLKALLDRAAGGVVFTTFLVSVVPTEHWLKFAHQQVAKLRHNKSFQPTFRKLHFSPSSHPSIFISSSSVAFPTSDPTTFPC
jgi:hypothetical protein